MNSSCNVDAQVIILKSILFFKNRWACEMNTWNCFGVTLWEGEGKRGFYNSINFNCCWKTDNDDDAMSTAMQCERAFSSESKGNAASTNNRKEGDIHFVGFTPYLFQSPKIIG